MKVVEIANGIVALEKDRTRYSDFRKNVISITLNLIVVLSRLLLQIGCRTFRKQNLETI